MPFCTSCGTQLDADARFCITCGKESPSLPDTPPVVSDATAAVTKAIPKAVKVRRRNSMLWGIGGVLAVVCAYLYSTPYIALYTYKAAIEQRKFTELADAVDPQALKSSIKMIVASGFTEPDGQEREVGINSPSPVLGGLVSLLGGQTDKLIDKFVDEALKPGSLKRLETALSDGKSLMDQVPPKHRKEVETLLNRLDMEVHITTGYAGMNRFRLAVQHDAIGTVNLIFNRHNLLQWRLAGIESDETLPDLMRKAALVVGETKLSNAAIGNKKSAAVPAIVPRDSVSKFIGDWRSNNWACMRLNKNTITDRYKVKIWFCDNKEPSAFVDVTVRTIANAKQLVNASGTLVIELKDNEFVDGRFQFPSGDGPAGSESPGEGSDVYLERFFRGLESFDDRKGVFRNGPLPGVNVPTGISGTKNGY